jgi:hypothetical protein
MNKTHFMGLLLATLLLGAQPLLAQVCNSSVTATAPDSRYTDNGDGTVTDSQTGLMWRQCSEGQSTTGTACDTGSAATYTWQGALAQAQSVNNTGGFATYSDWRLPNRNELASLVENSCYDPAINMTTFPNTVASYYWSASPLASSSGYAWGVVFGGGYVGGYGKGLAMYVRLVRGGQ